MPKHAIRSKGGVICRDGRFHSMIDVWPNADCAGDPMRIVSDESFPTEAAALRHYICNVRPRLLEVLKQLTEELGGSLERREIWKSGSLEGYLL